MENGHPTRVILSPEQETRRVSSLNYSLYCRLINVGSIPEEFFSTKDSKSLEAFLKQTDVLVCSLPGTPQTQYLLDAQKLGKSAAPYPTDDGLTL